MASCLDVSSCSCIQLNMLDRKNWWVPWPKTNRPAKRNGKLNATSHVCKRKCPGSFAQRIGVAPSQLQLHATQRNSGTFWSHCKIYRKWITFFICMTLYDFKLFNTGAYFVVLHVVAAQCLQFFALLFEVTGHDLLLLKLLALEALRWFGWPQTFWPLGRSGVAPCHEDSMMEQMPQDLEGGTFSYNYFELCNLMTCNQKFWYFGWTSNCLQFFLPLRLQVVACCGDFAALPLFLEGFPSTPASRPVGEIISKSNRNLGNQKNMKMSGISQPTFNITLPPGTSWVPAANHQPHLASKLFKQRLGHSLPSNAVGSRVFLVSSCSNPWCFKWSQTGAGQNHQVLHVFAAFNALSEGSRYFVYSSFKADPSIVLPPLSDDSSAAPVLEHAKRRCKPPVRLFWRSCAGNIDLEWGDSINDRVCTIFTYNDH